jgi:CRP-like cAMP-binding protein
MKKKIKAHHNGHLNEHQHHSLLTLERERSELLDGELLLSYGPHGVTALMVPRIESKEPPGEPIGVRVSLHPFLAGMSHHHLMLLTDCATVTHFKKGEVILDEGELADRFYLIESGKVVLESVTREIDPVRVDTISAGELLGWSWMFPPYIWHFTARAIEPTDAIYFSGPALREDCEQVHSLGYELFKRMSVVMMKRLQSARGKILLARAGGMPHQPGERAFSRRRS